MNGNQEKKTRNLNNVQDVKDMIGSKNKMNYFELERKWLKWIENNKIKYDIGLVIAGILLGVGTGILYGSGANMIIEMSFAFAIIFLLSDLTVWGDK